MLIPIKTLVDKLKSLGIKEGLVATRNQVSIDQNKYGWKNFFRRRTSNPYVRFVLSQLGFLTSLLLSPIEKIEGKGGTYTMVFRKYG